MWKFIRRCFNHEEIFISNLPKNFTKENLSHLLPEESVFKLSKSYCFVKIPEGKNTKEIIKKLNESVIDGYKLRARLNTVSIKNTSQQQKDLAVISKIESKRTESET